MSPPESWILSLLVKGEVTFLLVWSHQVKKRGLEWVVCCCPEQSWREGHYVPPLDVAWTLVKSAQAIWD